MAHKKENDPAINLRSTCLQGLSPHRMEGVGKSVSSACQRPD